MNNPFGVQPEGTPWRTFRISKAFMSTLHSRFGHRRYITLLQAYTYYEMYHRRPYWSHQDKYWMEVTVRQYMSAAVQRGLMIRVRKGVYKFVKSEWTEQLTPFHHGH